MMDNPFCPLCGGASSDYFNLKERQFLQCTNCLSVFTHPKDFLSTEAEVAHYRKHNNNPEDVKYQNFVSPITNSILRDFEPHHRGLDFGSGTGSPISKLLTDARYDIVQYDLYFHNNQELLQSTYDYIACSETAEHFKDPYTEFKQLYSLLNPKGKLYVMTDRFKPEEREFKDWYYKTDPTHVFLYHDKAFEWIEQHFGFQHLMFEKRMVVLGV
jgi:SAM-dependent methyltransferase